MFSLPNRLSHGHTLAASHPATTHPELPVHRAGTRERTLLELVMPEYHFRGGASVTIEATPDEILRALETVTLAELPLASMIGTLRRLPTRLRGKTHPPAEMLTRPIVEVATPLLRLGEDPGREIVVGAAGRFHNLFDPQFITLPDLFTFTRFNDAGDQKLAVGFRAVPEAGGTRTVLKADHRTLALSATSRRRFAVTWYLVLGWSGNVLLRHLLKAVARRAEKEHRAAGAGD